MGEVREKQGRSQEAAAQYRSALDIHPFDAEALERLAGLHVREKPYQAALPDTGPLTQGDTRIEPDLALVDLGPEL